MVKKLIYIGLVCASLLPTQATEKVARYLNAKGLTIAKKSVFKTHQRLVHYYYIKDLLGTVEEPEGPKIERGVYALIFEYDWLPYYITKKGLFLYKSLPEDRFSTVGEVVVNNRRIKRLHISLIDEFLKVVHASGLGLTKSDLTQVIGIALKEALEQEHSFIEYRQHDDSLICRLVSCPLEQTEKPFYLSFFYHYTESKEKKAEPVLNTCAEILTEEQVKKGYNISPGDLPGRIDASGIPSTEFSRSDPIRTYVKSIQRQYGNGE